MTDNNKVKVIYDDKFDVLYFIVGPPASAESKPLDFGIYVRREVSTDRIAGAVIEHYSKRDKKTLKNMLPDILKNSMPNNL